MFIFFLWSCDKTNKEYYDNGNLKRVYIEENGQFQSDYFEYFDDGITLKEKHNYLNGVNVDTSFFYYPNEKMTRLKVWNDTLSQYKSLVLNKNNEVIVEGISLKNNDSMNVDRIGIWRFSGLNKIYEDSLVEYLNVFGESYVNQVWVRNKNKDTLQNYGNHFDLQIYDKENQNDTTLLGHITRLKFVLEKPTYGYDSDIYIVLPYNDDELENDFSNLTNIERDTFPSLKNDGIPRSDVPGYIRTNLFVEFGLEYSKPGEKRVRGVLVETASKSSKSYGRERRLFFDETFYIRDTITSASPR